MSVKFLPNVRLSNTELQNFLYQNALGDLRDIKLLSKGVESTTYLIRTNRDSYILNLFENLNEDLVFNKKASNYFSLKGFPIPNILGIGQILGKPASITTILPGKVLSDWNESHYESVGFFLGNLHLSAAPFSQPSPKTPFIWQLSENFYQIKDQIPQEFKLLEQEIFSVEEAWPTDLPKGFIHGDIWNKNILFLNNSLSGALDFSPSYEPYILELANLIKGIPLNNTTFLPALLSGYEVARPLSEVELSSLELLVHAKTLSTILYLLKQAIEKPLRKDEFQTYAFLSLLKLIK